MKNPQSRRRDNVKEFVETLVEFVVDLVDLVKEDPGMLVFLAVSALAMFGAYQTFGFK